MLLRVLYGISVFLLLVAGVLFYAKLGSAEHPLIVHWSNNGIDFVGTAGTVWGIIGTGAVMAAVNGALSSVFLPRQKIIAYLIAGATAFLSLLILIAVGGIVSIN